LKSLAEQIRLLYFENLSAPKPFQLYLTGLGTGSKLHQILTNNTPNFNSYQVEVTERGYDSLFSPQDIVYLSPDSEQDLEEVDRYKVYVIGGIVDRSSPSKNLTLHRARVAGLETARLPISRFMEFAKPSPHNLNLPINIVTSMLLDLYRGHEWPRVLQRHMPKRKGYRIKPELSYTLDNRVHEQTP
jgi:tRNA (guanine9-N1)-methyltransferase